MPPCSKEIEGCDWRIGLDSGEEDAVLLVLVDWKSCPEVGETSDFTEGSCLGEGGFLYAVALAANAFLPINFCLARLIAVVNKHDIKKLFANTQAYRF